MYRIYFTALVVLLLAASSHATREHDKQKGHQKHTAHSSPSCDVFTCKPSLVNECLYDVAGGAVGATGSLAPQPALANKECTEVFHWYFKNSGQYYFDLKTVRDASLKAYKNATLGFKHDGSDLVIFDIDETCLSNAEFIVAAKFEPQTAALLALEPIKTVYTTLYDLGFSLALITGRNETYRPLTERNLKEQGFGVRCKRDGNDKPVRSHNGPCYVELDMRDLKTDLTKPAAVYKPERRGKLVKLGYRLVGSFGDQFSDLIGPNTPSYIWKIPNPLYTIA